MPHEEMRKIIKAGNTSFAVILPRSWLRYYGLTNKDKVKVTSNSTITIEPLENKKQKGSDVRREDCPPCNPLSTF